MKSRKKLEHVELVEELIGQCMGRFKPDIQVIKKNIEQLIEKSFLDRDGSKSSYVYVA